MWAPPNDSLVDAHQLVNNWVYRRYGYGSIPIHYIPFLGDEHPFTSYFDVHQGYKVLTHPHITIVDPNNFG
jgi:hypothetical protein